MAYVPLSKRHRYQQRSPSDRNLPLPKFDNTAEAEKHIRLLRELQAKIMSFSGDEQKAVKDYHELAQESSKLYLPGIEDTLSNMSSDESRHYNNIDNMTMIIGNRIKEIEEWIKKKHEENKKSLGALFG